MITKTEIDYIAKLARMNLTEEEISSLSNDLENILSYIAQLKTLDVTNVKPTSHVLSLKNVYRSDEATPSFTQEQALSIATAKLDGFFKVPQIID